jgi:hypothetical protein
LDHVPFEPLEKKLIKTLIFILLHSLLMPTRKHFSRRHALQQFRVRLSTVQLLLPSAQWTTIIRNQKIKINSQIHLKTALLRTLKLVEFNSVIVPYKKLNSIIGGRI